jgi:tRNA-specific 2-thiouridylase
MSIKNKKVFVGMSGGVDSSVAAYLLKKQGYDVVGVFMRCYNLDGCAERDAEDARRAAEHIGIPFYVWDFEKEYKRRVVKYMVDGYRAGITPNPDVMCNREIKFGLFFEKALSMGADYVATGHYVKLKVKRQKSKAKNIHSSRLSTLDFQLCAARDSNKDQSYFLWMLAEGQLRRCLFPIGNYLKPKVREIARKAKLPTADKKDSQGICFLGMVDISDFLKQYIPEHRGALITTMGETIGEHFGSEFYTIGQRHLDADFKFPKTGAVARKPFYVAAKNFATNVVVVAEGSENPALYKKEILLKDVHWILKSMGPRRSLSRALSRDEDDSRHRNGELSVFARVRYRQPLAKAILQWKVKSGKSKVIKKKQGADLRLSTFDFQLIFNQPQKFVAPGQSAVFYGKNGTMLGGGVIK